METNEGEVVRKEEEIEKKIQELHSRLEDKQAEIDSQFDILKSISGVYDYINLVDFDTQTAYRFDEKASVAESFYLIDDPHTSLNKNMAPRMDGQHHERFMAYTNLSTLDGRMRGKKLISDDFKFANGDWVRAMYIRIGDDVNEQIHKVAYALRNITQDRRREEQIYSALTNLVYSLHIFDLENDTMERLIESEIFKKIVGDEVSAQKMSYTIMRATSKEEYLDFMLEFVDLSTVSERMKGKSSLSCEFVGRFHGWTRMTFVPIEMQGDRVKKIVVMTEIIDSEKNELINLIYKSSTDELTRLYNRRTYEEDLDAIDESNDMNQLVVVAMDVNGLKKVNDTIGHKAGDELIIGASKCIANSFRPVGKAYRTGGDEFMALIRCKEENLPEIFQSFEQSVDEWSGNLVERLSVSYGYVLAEKYPMHKVKDLASEADKMMYDAKAEYYTRNGMNRRRG